MVKLYLPFEDWPDEDHAAWTSAIRDGDVLDGRGVAAHWRETTRRTNIHHYSRWLSFLMRQGSDIHATTPAERVTEETVRAYVGDLRSRVAPRTVVSSLVGLKVMMKALAPELDWHWLAVVCNRLNVQSAPSKDKRARMRSTTEIHQHALNELERLRRTTLGRRIERVAFRDALMIALMACRPLRLGNFTSLDIGGRFHQEAGHWMIEIPGNETKNGDPLTFDVPATLVPCLHIYLGQIRPAFLANAQAETNALWLGFQGQPLAYHTVHCRIVYVTRKWFGMPINPHLFRDCAATTMSSCSVEDALASAALLGHRNFATTEKHYIRANQLEASRLVASQVSRIARELMEQDR